MINILPLFVRYSCAYLIEAPDELILVDSGAPGSEKIILNKMQRLGRDDLRLIYLTHAHLDHFGSAAALRRSTGAPIAIHSADAGFLAEAQSPLGTAHGRGRLLKPLLPVLEALYPPQPTQADILLEDMQNLSQWCGMDARVLHTPGHTPGSCCLLVEGKHLFAGDLVSNTGKPHLQRYFATDWRQIPQSLKRVQALNPDWVYPGHGRHPLSGDEFQLL